eukprot:5021806-Prymnesium_polylepis.2
MRACCLAGRPARRVCRAASGQIRCRRPRCCSTSTATTARRRSSRSCSHPPSRPTRPTRMSRTATTLRKRRRAVDGRRRHVGVRPLRKMGLPGRARHYGSPACRSGAAWEARARAHTPAPRQCMVHVTCAPVSSRSPRRQCTRAGTDNRRTEVRDVCGHATCVLALFWH